MTGIVIESDAVFGLLVIAVAIGLTAVWTLAEAIARKIRRRHQGDD